MRRPMIAVSLLFDLLSSAASEMKPAPALRNHRRRQVARVRLLDSKKMNARQPYEGYQ